MSNNLLVEVVAVALEANILHGLGGERESLHDTHFPAGLLAGYDSGPVIIISGANGNIERLDPHLVGGLHEKADRHAVDLQVSLQFEGDLGALAVDRVVLIEIPIEEVLHISLRIGVLGMLDLHSNNLQHGSAITLSTGTRVVLRVDFVDLLTVSSNIREVDTSASFVFIVVAVGRRGWRRRRKAVYVTGRGGAGRLSIRSREIVLLRTLDLLGRYNNQHGFHGRPQSVDSFFAWNQVLDKK